ncbi:CXADR-like membrane protein [Lates japonicus]|uniref:CXADR-like membrane protein n=1 Tax=Lates japonicus TaxID=270547 RepID=A0AAD3NIC7_LATJO|nr:CXADR-like membrane protein [Lates japonicus]
MRHFGRLFWIILIYGVSTVSCQVKVEGFISDSVLLPCIYREDPLPDQYTVHYGGNKRRQISTGHHQQESGRDNLRTQCSKVDFQQRVQLTVAGVKPTPPPGPRVGGGAVTLSSSVLALLSAPVFLFWL